MLIVLDSNEYIFGFGFAENPSSAVLLDRLAASAQRFSLRIPRTTVEDARDELSPEAMKAFFAFLRQMGAIIDEDQIVPYEFPRKYEALGLKPGDAFLAGYAEWVAADYLISENMKDFVNHPHLFSFKVIAAEKFLKEHLR